MIISYEAEMSLNVLEGAALARFEAKLPDVLQAQRWFGGKARGVSAVHIIDRIVIPSERSDTILVLDVAYRDGGHDTYVLPIALASGPEAQRIARERPRSLLASLTADDTKDHDEAIVYDAMWNPEAMQRLLQAIGDGAQLSGEAGRLVASPTTAYASIVRSDQPLSSHVLTAQQSNTSVAFGEQVLLKLYRRPQAGINPDWEIGRYLTAHGFAHSPAVGGAIEYVTPGETRTVALMQAFVPNQGDAWEAMIKALEGFFTRALQGTNHVDHLEGRDGSLWELAGSDLSNHGRALIGPALDAAVCLGRRTAALHRVLGQEHDDPNFASEPLTAAYLQTRHESMRGLWNEVVRLLEQRSVTGGTMPAAQATAAEGRGVLAVFQTLLDVKEGGRRIRCHGDFHLGQVLWTGVDYVVTDFEGEPARPLHERRLKHSPVYDVAGMLRSFEYASSSAIAGPSNEASSRLEPWSSYWSRWVRAYFLKAYLDDIQDAPFWPTSRKDAARLLTVHELEKAVYELGYELNNRPEWAAIPLKGISEIIRMSGVRAAA